MQLQSEKITPWNALLLWWEKITCKVTVATKDFTHMQMTAHSLDTIGSI